MAGEALSQGTILRIQTGGTVGAPTYTAVENVSGWPGFGDAREFDDITTLGSTATEKLAKLPVSGSSGVELVAKYSGTGINLAPGQQAVENAYISGSTLSFEVELPAALGGATYTRLGIVTKFDIVAQTNTAVRISTTIEWSGAWVKS